jgi:hypothetical protein
LIGCFQLLECMVESGHNLVKPFILSAQTVSHLFGALIEEGNLAKSELIYTYPIFWTKLLARLLLSASRMLGYIQDTPFDLHIQRENNTSFLRNHR